MLQTPLTGIYYRMKENAVVTCDFHNFQATLTNKRLIINRQEQSESIMLSAIRAVTIYDDYEQYRVRKTAFIHRRKRLHRVVGAITLAAAGIALFPAFWFISFMIGAITGYVLSSFLPIKTSGVAMPSLLLIIQSTQTKEYAFDQVKGMSINNIAKFMLCMEEALT
ncbi:hypothetical protein SAMN05421788_109143 [Filimonas lacunae]|uniref:Uncharacterized protein n=1 Tax=Filimonas lacunae TaxID=477680 RepID=A0A173MIP9_9BACT|nr:hypothetical protein [Filimonas lacunae]BAV07504.1 hypothetical protein FLA_3530 [Filimonas lacunae]SIT30153.1 hypothetical protein SAMN05421788_109143 [Filimonas lacunae]